MVFLTHDGRPLPLASMAAPAWAEGATVTVRLRAPATVPAAAPEPVAALPSVQLGFADGTTLELEADDPRSVALRQVAARLTGDAP